MYNAILSVKIESVAPYSTEKKNKTEQGIFVTASMQVGDAKIFDDVDFGKNRNGLQNKLNGSLPVRGTAVHLAFIKKKDTTIDVEKVKGVPVTIDDIFTGSIKNGSIPVKLKLNIKKLDEEIAGLFAAALNDDVEIKIKSSQQDLPLTSEPDAKPAKPIGDGKQRTTGRLKVIK